MMVYQRLKTCVITPSLMTCHVKAMDLCISSKVVCFTQHCFSLTCLCVPGFRSSGLSPNQSSPARSHNAGEGACSGGGRETRGGCPTDRSGEPLQHHIVSFGHCKLLPFCTGPVLIPCWHDTVALQLMREWYVRHQNEILVEVSACAPSLKPGSS